MLTNFICFILIPSITFFMGYRARGWKDINYKKRWQEANRLLQQERVNTGELQQLESGPKAGEWKPSVITTGIYTKVAVTNGKKSIPIKDVWIETTFYESSLSRAVTAAQDRAKQLNKVGAT